MVQSILFHRGVYPAEDFCFEKRFGLDLALIIVPSIEDYLELTLLRIKGMSLQKCYPKYLTLHTVAKNGSRDGCSLIS
jgi:mitotic spindle assembly checkpoint protein MAD2